MPKKQLINTLVRALDNEKKCDWTTAIEFHQKNLNDTLQQDNLLRAGEIAERISHCLYRIAMQAKSRSEFKKKIKLSIEACQRAQGFYELLPEQQKSGRETRSKAVATYLHYWLTPNGKEKRKLLDESLKLEEKALAQFKLEKNFIEYCRTYNSLWLLFYLRGFLEWDDQALFQLVQKGMEWGKKATSTISEATNPHEAAWANFVFASCLSFISSIEGIGVPVIEIEESVRNYPKAIAALEKALFLSEKIGDSFLKGMLHLWLGYSMRKRLDSQTYYEKALQSGVITQDRLLTGLSYAALADIAFWQSSTDSAKGMKSLEVAKELYDKSQKHNSITNLLSPTGGELAAPHGYAAYYREKAIGFGSDPQKRLEFLKIAEKIAVKALREARLSDMPRAMVGSFHCLSYSLAELAKLEIDPKKKRHLLREAIAQREHFIRIVEQVEPFAHFSIGVGWSHLAENKAQLAEIESDPQAKEQLLKQAVAHSEKSLELCSKLIPYFERIGDFDYLLVLGRIIDRFEATLKDLHDLTKQSSILRQTINLLQSSVKLAKKQGVVGLEAVSYWKIAKAQSALEEHYEAAENFRRASESYLEAARRSPQLKDFYAQQAFYMQAWCEIEKAKEAHSKKNYSFAKTCYEKAARLHESTIQWSCLSSNYLAWAQLEAAEDLSRREKTEKASEAFLEAANLFERARESIKTKYIEEPDTKEKKLADVLFKASVKRREYCLGRIALEEAKIQDRRGDHLLSSRKYGLAAKIFESIAVNEEERSHQELLLISYLCQAWSRMMIAEETMSSKAFKEAAELFNQAKRHSFDRENSLLALANCSFCKALAAGNELEITGNPTAYSDAKKHMEAAENGYLKAGFASAAEYAKATSLLLDGYMFKTKAETQPEPVEKAKYYNMAERTLNVAVDSYLRAKRPEKSEEVQRLLENIIEKRQLAMSLMSVLPDPTIITTTKLFSAPTPTHEEAVGFERFKHAELEANLTISEELTTDEQIDVKLAIINVGKQAALLLRIQGLIPTDFEATLISSQAEIEEDLINLKGKRLEPLSVDSIEILIQTSESGIFSLKPRISYIDEIGNFKQCFPKPMNIMVHPKLKLEFRTDAAEKVFEYLSRSFVEDYMRRKLALQESGWRSLAQVMKNSEVSSRKIYGTRRKPGIAVFELEKRGLIEKRVFHGRGRGGKIVRTRICYERDIVKRLIDHKVIKK
jgi:hypothetical protein